MHCLSLLLMSVRPSPLYHLPLETIVLMVLSSRETFKSGKTMRIVPAMKNGCREASFSAPSHAPHSLCRVACCLCRCLRGWHRPDSARQSVCSAHRWAVLCADDAIVRVSWCRPGQGSPWLPGSARLSTCSAHRWAETAATCGLCVPHQATAWQPGAWQPSARR